MKQSTSRLYHHVVAESDDLDAQFLRRRQWHPEPSRSAPVRAVDLFSGAGGLSLGAREASARLERPFEVRLAVDLDPGAMRIYEHNFTPTEALTGDLDLLLDGELGTAATAAETRLVESLCEIDLLLAGPPCQGHSSLNNHTRHSDVRNRLYLRAVRFVELIRPTHVVIENVPTVTVAREGSLATAVEVLAKLGYQVDSEVVDLSELGVPQRRRRHVLVASTEANPSVAAAVALHRVVEPRTVAWAIGDLMDQEGRTFFDTASALSPVNAKRASVLLQHSLYDLPDKDRPTCHASGGHKYKSMYGRLRWDEPAQTITSGYGSPGQGRFFHPVQPRTLTAHEAARLQFFPDFFDFSLETRRKKLAKLIGNAVPPKLAEVLVASLLQ